MTPVSKLMEEIKRMAVDLKDPQFNIAGCREEMKANFAAFKKLDPDVKKAHVKEFVGMIKEASALLTDRETAQNTPNLQKSEMLQEAKQALEDVKNNVKTPDEGIKAIAKNHAALKEAFKQDQSKPQSLKDAEIAEFKVIIGSLKRMQQAAKADQQNPEQAKVLRAQQSKLTEAGNGNREAMYQPNIHQERVMQERQNIVSFTQGHLGGAGPSTPDIKAPAPSVYSNNNDNASGPSKEENTGPSPKDILASLKSTASEKSENYASKRKESKGIKGLLYNKGRGSGKEKMFQELVSRLDSINPDNKGDDFSDSIIKVLDEMDKKLNDSPSQEVSDLVQSMRKEVNATLETPEPSQNQSHRAKQ